MNILKKLYNWTILKAKHRRAVWFLSIISFTESSFFPIPPDIILIPMIIAKRVNAFFYAFVCTVSSVAGGLFGYLIGFFLFNSLGILILDYYGLENLFEIFEQYYYDYGVLIILGASFTPFPFKFITIASGFFGLNILLFLITATIGRGFRFYLVALLLKLFGKTIEYTIDKYFNTLTILFLIVFIGSIVILKFL